jgi:3-hydroxyisobutyrate dehydrogenase-like beta-hydroxyacid dehydrogenase
MTARPVVGVIGLGIMSGAMAEALIAAGYAVAGYDPQPAARQRLRRAGGTPLASSTAVAARADRHARLPDLRHRGAHEGRRVDHIRERVKRAFREIGPILRVFTAKVPYCGAYGNGTKMKFAANHLVAILNVATAESITFGRKGFRSPTPHRCAKCWA